MIRPEQIEALGSHERRLLIRQLVDAELPTRQRYRLQYRFGQFVRVVVTLGAVVLVPWTIYMAVSLPRRTFTAHWRLAWVGFDLLLGATLAMTAYFAWQRRQLVVVGLAGSAVLLVCDAWFDVTLTHGSGALISLAMALLIELPVAVSFLWAIVALHRANADVVWSLSGHMGERPDVMHFPLLPTLVDLPDEPLVESEPPPFQPDGAPNGSRSSEGA